ncbi:MAG: metal ABC transporter ATP-binding protein [Bacillota bacterium]
MKEVIRADQVQVELGGKKILEDITFNVSGSELTGIIGPNGAGKTTLLRAVLGLVPVYKGSLEVFGVPVNRLKKVRPRIGYMPQRQSFERRFPLSAADVVAGGLLTSETLLRRVSAKDEKINTALRFVNMESYYSRPFQDLSGGEQQRILLARALVRQPELLLLDEPSAGLDFPAQQSFIELIQSLKEEKGLTILIVSHDLVSVASTADMLVCINRTMHIHGHPADVLHSPCLDEAYRCQFDLLSNIDKGGDRS